MRIDSFPDSVVDHQAVNLMKLLLEVKICKVIAEVGQLTHHRFSVAHHHVVQRMLGVYFVNAHYFAELICRVINVHLVYKVNQPSKVVFAGWHIQKNRLDLQPALDALRCRLCEAAKSVHLVDKADPGDVKAVGLLPHSF